MLIKRLAARQHGILLVGSRSRAYRVALYDLLSAACVPSLLFTPLFPHACYSPLDAAEALELSLGGTGSVLGVEG